MRCSHLLLRVIVPTKRPHSTWHTEASQELPSLRPLLAVIRRLRDTSISSQPSRHLGVHLPDSRSPPRGLTRVTAGLVGKFKVASGLSWGFGSQVLQALIREARSESGVLPWKGAWVFCRRWEVQAGPPAPRAHSRRFCAKNFLYLTPF